MIDNNSVPTPEPPASDKSPPAPAADPWKDRLKANMARDRNQMLRTVAVLTVVLALLAASGLWWIYPGPPLPPLFAVALDGLCLPEDEVELRLQLEPTDAAVPFPKNMAGLKVTFAEVGKTAPLARTTTDKFGQALAAVQFAEARPETKFQGRFDGNRQVKPSLDQGRVFFVPRGSALVLVELQDLLADPELDIALKDLNQIQLHQPTAKLLQSLLAEKKRIVYLALRSERVQDYHLARRWLNIRGLPPGPLLGRPSYHDERSAEEAHRQILGELTARWQVSAVGRRREGADFYRQAGISYREVGK